MSILALSFIAISGSAHAHGMDSGSDNGNNNDNGNPPPHWPYHAFLVSTGLIFMTAGMLTARYKKGRRWWLKAHKMLGLIGASLAVIGIFTAAYLLSTYFEVYFVGELHSYLGIGAVTFVILTPIMGYMQFKLKDKRIRAAHRWLGRLALVFMLANIAVGLQMVLK
ncbi:MAG: DUF998 domain-containing protein [Methanotrichaceae archaeon]